MVTKITFDKAGFEAVLKSELAGPTAAAAQRVAAAVNLGTVADAAVTVHTGVTTDMRINRPHALVSIEHPAGLRMQAKHGTLTKAASSAGLKVKAKP